jgi:hypothetical protein
MKNRSAAAAGQLAKIRTFARAEFTGLQMPDYRRPCRTDRLLTGLPALPGRSCPATSVTGKPGVVKPLSTATLTLDLRELTVDVRCARALAKRFPTVRPIVGETGARGLLKNPRASAAGGGAAGTLPGSAGSLAKAIALATQRARRIPAWGPKPPASARPGQASASVVLAERVARSRRASGGEAQCVSSSARALGRDAGHLPASRGDAGVFQLPARTVL